MASNLNIFLNSPVVENNVFSIIGDIALEPYKYLFAHRIFKVIQGRPVKLIYAKERKDSRTFLNTALMVALLVPAILIGIIAKLFSYLSKDVRDNHNALRLYFHSSCIYDNVRYQKIIKSVAFRPHRENDLATLEKKLRYFIKQLKDNPKDSTILFYTAKTLIL